ncbi:MAG: hypothetical protein M1829_004534 [Trizodia sp. TS-e1964]|nr:MAG: hypothetical protein M1829_004534 [Trizodia sp. TS-e1964]
MSQPSPPALRPKEMPTATRLNVIALVSGGKDSFFCLHHCLAHGHRIVALANLHPPVGAADTPHGPSNVSTANASPHIDTHIDTDMDSLMYQTVGHSVIPLYAEALGLPLYRHPIAGQPLNTRLTYFPRASGSNEHGDGDEDETEALLPLLRRILTLHPTANAVSSGAILSTYQRTRIESVALRLRITSLAFLWQYPLLPPGRPTSLLQDMQMAGLHARIVKVASGGLDESMLWLNVASDEGVRRLLRALRRLGPDALRGGAVLGEGGEYETLVVQGPPPTWKGRIRIEGRSALDAGAGAVRVGFGGAKAWLDPFPAGVGADEATRNICIRIPPLLDPTFHALLRRNLSNAPQSSAHASPPASSARVIPQPLPPPLPLPLSPPPPPPPCSTWHVQATGMSYMLTLLPTPSPHASLAAELRSAFGALATTLATLSTPSASASAGTMTLTHATVLLRSMSAFAALNSAWHAAFRSTSPPARVTLACGDLLPRSSAVLMHILAQHGDGRARKPLHVQSRSYWAPASIGPYAQAVGVPLASGEQASIVHLAGQIPLVPASMELASRADLPAELAAGASDEGMLFTLHAALSLQHIWRVGAAMRVAWWMASVAFIAARVDEGDEAENGGDGEQDVFGKAKTALEVWKGMHLRPSPDANMEHIESEEGDAWAMRNSMTGLVDTNLTSEPVSPLPDFSLLRPRPPSPGCTATTAATPPLVVAQVWALPRAAAIEWAATGFAPASCTHATPCIEQCSSAPDRHPPDQPAQSTPVSPSHTTTLSLPPCASPALRITHTAFPLSTARAALASAVQCAIRAEVGRARQDGLQVLKATLYVARAEETDLAFAAQADIEAGDVLVAVVPCVRLWSWLAGESADEGAHGNGAVAAVLVTWLEG